MYSIEKSGWSSDLVRTINSKLSVIALDWSTEVLMQTGS